MNAGDAPDYQTIREGQVVCSTSSTDLTKTKYASDRGVTTSDTKAYGTFAHVEGRTVSNDGSKAGM